MRRYWPVAVALAWVVSRAPVVWLLRGRHEWVQGDLHYFARSLTEIDQAGLARTLVEYPLPGVVVAAVPWLVADLLGDLELYGDAVLVLSLFADAAFTALLALAARPRRAAALVVWLLAVPLLGATVYARFDLVPGVLAGAAVLFLAERPRLAAGLGALATGFKLWPALVLPALAARESSRRPVLLVIGAVGVLLAGASVLAAGWARLLSPLTWQADRGLQIESVAATPAMGGWVLSPAGYDVAFSEHNAYEVFGPGAQVLLATSEALSLVVLPALLALWYLALRHGEALTIDTVVWLALAAVGLFMVTSKVLSPQYLLWLLPLASVAAGLVRSRAVLVWAGLLLVAAAVTQVVFPELYGHLTHDGEHAGWAVLALAVRNLLLVVLVVWAAAAAVRGVSAASRSIASRRQGGATSAPSGEERPTPT